MRKHVSLNRFIATCAIVIGVISITVLIFIDISLISNYQKLRRTTEEGTLSKYVNKCSNDFKEIASFGGDISMCVPDFVADLVYEKYGIK